MIRQIETNEDKRKGTEKGQSLAKTNIAKVARTHVEYWKGRLRKRSYVDRSGKQVEIQEYQIRLKREGRESWFNLGTGNQEAAATKAREIYLSLAANGWGPTLAKYKPDQDRPAKTCTIGAFLENVQERSHLKPITVRRYAVKLRKLVSDVARLEKDVRGK